VIAIIPARGGSKSIPRKNIVDLNGHPLIAYAITRGLEAGFDVFVSTDDGEIWSIAESYGAKVIGRPKELAQDDSGDLEVFRHAVDYLNLPRYETIVHLRATTPMIYPEELVNATHALPTNFYTSLRSAHEMSESAYKCFVLDGADYVFRSVSTSHEDQERPRQLVPKTYKPNGYIDIVRPEWFMERENTLHGPMIKPFITKFTPEVDSLEELEYIGWLMRKHDYWI
jgi:CMP-N-acetylneuraminic acid synthetase